MNSIRRFAASFSVTGLILGLGFFSVSLTPSLLPRATAAQGILSGVVFAAGYGIGIAGRWLWRYMELRDLPRRLNVILAWTLTGSLVLVAVITLSRMTVWQNSIRSRMAMDPIDYSYHLGVVFVALAAALAFILLMRLLLYTVRKVIGYLNRYLPRRISTVLGSLVLVLLLMSLVDRFILKTALNAMDESFSAMNRILDDEYDPPLDNLASGSVQSLIDWKDIGKNGKRFISDGPAKEEISKLLGREAMQPIRVYAGYDTGETLEERARIALLELQRVGGFDRSTLIVATATGTGWLDPSAVNTVEFIHAGDIATVSMQYSYLPSWLTLMVEPEASQAAAIALFNEVYGYWTTLHHDDRPDLYLFGLSLGALGSETSADLIAMMGDPIKGALWSGPPFPNTRWLYVTQRRNPGTPQWRPVFRDSTAIRFMTQDGFSEHARGEWGPMRIIYLQHASDPMTWFSPDLAFKRPDWLGHDRGRDVSPYFRWFPIVTFFQVAFDIPMATSVPIGYGHNFAPNCYIDAWIEVTQPQNWSAADTDKLKAHFAGFDPNPL